jgi:hypothetical protein
MKRTIIAAGVASVATALLLLDWAGRGTADIQIINRANEPVAGGGITVAGQASPIGTLEIGQAKRLSFAVPRASSYLVSVQFNSGKTVRKEVGYLTWGACSMDEIAIEDDGISLTREDKKPASK